MQLINYNIHDSQCKCKTTEDLIWIVMKVIFIGIVVVVLLWMGLKTRSHLSVCMHVFYIWSLRFIWYLLEICHWCHDSSTSMCKHKLLSMLCCWKIVFFLCFDCLHETTFAKSAVVLLGMADGRIHRVTRLMCDPLISLNLY